MPKRLPRPATSVLRFASLILTVLAGLLAVAQPLAGQTFVQPTVVPTGNWNKLFYPGDFDGDGHLDFIYYTPLLANGLRNLNIAFGEAGGAFSTPVGQSTVYEGADLATAADVNRDGMSDFVDVVSAGVGGYLCEVFVWFGAPKGSFNHPNATSTFACPGINEAIFSSALAADVNGDGNPDLVLTATSTNMIYLLLGDGTGKFNLKAFYPLPDGAGTVSIADLNSDGKIDLVVNSATTFTADVFLGNGDGTFGFSGSVGSFGRFAGSSSIHSMLLKDVNNDGRPDLIAEVANGQIQVFAGNGDGTFQTTSLGGTAPLDGTTGNGGHLIALADLNHDGQLDALTSTPAGVSVLLGQGTGYFGLKGIYNAGPGHTSYTVADLNGDGNLDLAVDSPEGIAILYGNADGSFQTSQAFAAGKPAMSGALANFTSSGNVDAVVSTSAKQAQLLHGNGDGSFTYAGAPGTPVPTTAQTGIAGLWSAVKVGDVDSDGIQDLVLTADGPSSLLPSTPDGTVIQSGNGDGTFTAPVAPAAIGGSNSSPCPNGPGPLYGTSSVYSFRENSNGPGYTTPVSFLNVLSADSARRFAGSDLVGAKSFPHPVSSVATGLAPSCQGNAHNLVISGTFTNSPYFSDSFVQQQGHLQLVFASEFGTAFLGDLSIDGSLTTVGQPTAPALSFNFNGPPIPVSSGGLGFPAFIGAAASADLDGDGNTDLIVMYANLSANLRAPTASAPNYIYLWYGSGGGKFLTSAKHPVNPVRLTPSRNFYQVAVADMNGDGIPDLILSDGYILSIQLGKGDGTFGAETHYLGGQGINSISVADVNHDGKPDLVLANGGAVLTNPVANLEVLTTNADVNTGGITVLLNQATSALQAPAGTVTATPEPTTYGEAFGLAATIPPNINGTLLPTGTVAFSIDGNSIGSANLTGATATIYPPANVYGTLTVGTHMLTAVYSGDSNYAQATFTGTHTVSLIPTKIGLSLCVDPPGSSFPCGVNFPTVAPPLLSPVTMYFGQSIDGLATESASDLTGQIIFYNGSSVFCTLNANLQQGGMVCPAASGFFPVGTTTVTVDYTGDPTHAASMSNGVQVIVSPDITTAIVTSSQNPSALGQSVTLTANVQGNFAVATGSVTFLDGNTVLGMGTLDGTGHATLTTANLALGHHPITVSYAANANFDAAVSPVLMQVVTTAVTGTVVASPEPSVVGNAFILTATIIPPPASAATIPTGTVAFSIDGTLVGQAALANGVATLAGPVTLAVGTHILSAVYSGDANYLTATFVGGHAVILSPTTTTLLPTGSTTIYYGQPANSGYNVFGTSSAHPPTGFITVQDNGVSVPYCTAIVLNSSCPYADGGANKLTVGTHALVVLYLGDSFNAPSASQPLVFTVLPDTTSATLTSSDDPAIAGTSVTFTAKLAGNYVTPSGTVSFLDGATTLGTATLDGNGGATFTTSSLALGTHPIAVVYNSNPNLNPVTSAILNQFITDGPTTFTITVTPTPVRVEIGHAAVLQVKVTATGGFAEPVQLSCPSVPEEATCLFTETVIPAGGGFSALYFSPRAPGDCGSGTPYSADLESHPVPTTAGIVLACLAMLPLYRRRRLLTRSILVSLVTLCGLAALSGCSHCTDLGTRPGTYTFTVTGTAQGSTPLTASQTSTVTVTTIP